jgi:hypothetical protein
MRLIFNLMVNVMADSYFKNNLIQSNNYKEFFTTETKKAILKSRYPKLIVLVKISYFILFKLRKNPVFGKSINTVQ